jgi:SAM-dependent methyltransferase
MMPLSLAQRPRTLAAEILDDLPADHPDARCSRRDLRWFNAALGNWRWIEAALRRHSQPGERILEIGAGTGELGERLVSRGFLWAGLDRAPRPPNCPADATWHRDDIFKFGEWDQYPVVVGNLVFHHFDEAQLRELGEQLRRHARLIIIGDLRRGRIQQALFFLLAGAIGANRISRHDGWLSIEAAFRGGELPVLLGCAWPEWEWVRERSQPSAYRVVIRRRI